MAASKLCCSNKGLHDCVHEGKSSFLQVFYKAGVLKNFKTFTGKYLPCGLFFNKVVQNQPTEVLRNLLLKTK